MATALRERRVSPARAELRQRLDQTETRLRRLIRPALRDLGNTLNPDEWRGAHATGQLPPDTEDRIRRRLEALRAELTLRLIRDRPIMEQITPESLAAWLIGSLVADLSTTALATLRAQLQLLFEFGATKELLKAIAQTTGLHERQLRAVENARQHSLAGGATEQVAARVANGVRDRLLDYRSKLIARTEATRYTNAVILQRAEALTAEGRLVTLQWLSARDGNVDQGNPHGPCIVNDNGLKLPFGQVFPSGDLQPPAHPGCRCLLELWIEEAAVGTVGVAA